MATKEEITRLRRQAAEMRLHIVRMMGANKPHHFGGSLSAADIVTALYLYKMRYDPQNPDWPERDRFIMSKGHSVPAQYAALAMIGVLPLRNCPPSSAWAAGSRGTRRCTRRPAWRAARGRWARACRTPTAWPLPRWCRAWTIESTACWATANYKRDSAGRR